MGDLNNPRRAGPMQFTYCPHPACCALAEILDRFTLQSTDGPVEHVRVLCLNRHRFALPVDSLPARYPEGVEERTPTRYRPGS